MLSVFPSKKENETSLLVHIDKLCAASFILGMANININVNPTLHVHADQVAHGALEKTDECADVKGIIPYLYILQDFMKMSRCS